MRKSKKFSQSITAKALTIVALALLLLIPQAMVNDLIRERKYRSIDTIEKINAKWSYAQTLCGPVLSIPYTQRQTGQDGKSVTVHNELLVTPEQLNIITELFPEERHYGIYKTILYKSKIGLEGAFPKIQAMPEIQYDWANASVIIGLSDLRGITENIRFNIGAQSYLAEAGGAQTYYNFGNPLVFSLHEGEPLPGPDNNLKFRCDINLNGSSKINFIPIARTTKAEVSGKWTAPGFIGSFTPEYTLTDDSFTASWSVLHFNRNIPDYWVNGQEVDFDECSFGVDLVDTVDHYQQNTRSAKYAIMFIALTFTLFFFVEVLTGRRIHPIQYLLIGAALILFYSLLLSFSEQIGFGYAYLVAAFATIALITAYTHSIFKNKTYTAILTALLCALYLFLYIVLQLEDIALLIGSVGLFAILSVIMYASRKVNWYKQEECEH